MSPTRTLASGWHWLLAGGGASALFLATLIGSLIAFYGDDAFDYAYDRLRPVSKARVADVQRVHNELQFRMIATRLRKDCKMVGSFAYGLTPEGFHIKAHASRLDNKPPEDLPVGIEVDVGMWRVWPVDGAQTMVVYMHHACAGRIVSTKLLEVPV